MWCTKIMIINFLLLCSLPMAIEFETTKRFFLKEKLEEQAVTNSLSILFRKGNTVLFSGNSKILMIVFVLAASAHYDHLRIQWYLLALGHRRLPFPVGIAGKNNSENLLPSSVWLSSPHSSFVFKQHWALGGREMYLWADCVFSVAAYCHFRSWQDPWLPCDTVYKIAFAESCPCVQLCIFFSPRDMFDMFSFRGILCISKVMKGPSTLVTQTISDNDQSICVSTSITSQRLLIF